MRVHMNMNIHKYTHLSLRERRLRSRDLDLSRDCDSERERDLQGSIHVCGNFIYTAQPVEGNCVYIYLLSHMYIYICFFIYVYICVYMVRRRVRQVACPREKSLCCFVSERPFSVPRGVRHGAFTCMIRLIHIYIHMTRLIYIYDTTDSHVWHDSFICVTDLMHSCNMTHPYG